STTPGGPRCSTPSRSTTPKPCASCSSGAPSRTPRRLAAWRRGAGCYELKDLPLALYRVTVRLAAFDNVTRDRLIVGPAHPTRLDITMRLSPICECISAAGGLAERWDHAAAVLHLRLSDSEPGPSIPQGYYRHLATVIGILKPPPAGLRSNAMFLLQ